MSDLSAFGYGPFGQVARWVQRVAPAGWRGLVVVGLEADPAALPKGARVRLALPESAILWREVDAPGAERRAAVVQARLEEVSPWAAGAFHWAEAGEVAGRLRVALTAAGPVREMEARLGRDGRHLAEVTGAGLILVEDRAGAQALARRLVGIWALALAVGLGLAVWGGMRFSAAQAAGDLAGARLEKLAERASAMDDASRAALELARVKGEGVVMSQMLDRLAGSLPLDTWLETLRLTPEGFDISGRSAAPDAIIPALEGKGGFAAVDFAGASVRDAATGLFTFALTGQPGGVK